MVKLVEMSGIAKDEMKIKSINEAKIRRIDNKDPQNTLKTLELVDKSSITVELKDSEDFE